MGVQDDAERFEPASAEEWGRWLAEHHADTPGVWLVTARREADRALGYEAAIVEALRWGWVDSTQRPLDEHRSMMWYAPRRRGSVWTRRNKERVSRLQAEGRMEPAGAAAVAAARESGMWTLMDPVEDRVVPDDLADALAARPGAREHWEGFTPSAQKQVLAWIVLAKRPATRAARVAAAAEAAERGEPARYVIRRTAPARRTRLGRARRDGEQADPVTLRYSIRASSSAIACWTGMKWVSRVADVGDEEQPGVQPADRVGAVDEVVAAPQHPGAAVLVGVDDPDVGVDRDDRLVVAARASSKSGSVNSLAARERGARRPWCGRRTSSWSPSGWRSQTSMVMLIRRATR